MDASTKKRLFFVVKLVLSVGILGFIFYKILHRENASDLWARVSSISIPWVLGAFVVQLLAMGCSMVRWNVLLKGQGIHAPFLHLVRTFWIGRFYSTVSPGGWTGLDAYRIYDISTRTKKPARATATVLVDKLLGQGAFAVVVLVGSIFGARYIGTSAVLAVDGAFLGLLTMVVLLISRPTIFRAVSGRLPARVRTRLQTTVDAVCAYQGRTGLLLRAVGLSIGTHALTNFIYITSAHALGIDVSIANMFFAASMTVAVTLVPISINGVGVREATLAGLLAMVGVPHGDAVLIAVVAFVVDMAASALGGFFLLGKQSDPVIRVEHAEHEDQVNAQIELAPKEAWPQVTRGLWIGFAGGLLGGVILGIGEACVILASSGGKPEYSVLMYGAISYGIACAVGGAVAGAVLAWSGRLMQRFAVPEAAAYGRFVGAIVALPMLAIGAFRIRRDMYEELLVWKSPKGLLVLALCALVAAAIYFIVSTTFRVLVTRRPFAFLLRSWGTPALFMLIVAIVAAVTVTQSSQAVAPPSRPSAAAPAQAGPIIFIVVDTLRADRLPGYGYAQGRTPNLDAFARDAIRFENAFSNASWTRPSFATLLSGRYPSSHRTMGKSSSLPNEIVTLPEALQSSGYTTRGIVTNYNVAPFFHFDQGFDTYEYLDPDFVLGANDTAAKLLFIQFARQQIETIRARMGTVEPGGAYRDAETVNRSVFRDLGQLPSDSPWLLFVAYMDPHDPYFPHPYRGNGYSRAAHPAPAASEAPYLESLYNGEITYWDEHFGHLVAELRRRNLYDNATIVITGDHGEEFNEHGGFWHGTTLYDEQVHIPLFVKMPNGQFAGTTRSEWVQHVDVMPTLLHLNGVEVPNGVQGHNVFDAEQARDEVLAEESHEGNVLASLRARRAGAEYKIITANANNPRGLAPVELYRIDQDPREQVSLATELPEVRRHHEQQLAAAHANASHGAARAEEVVVGAGEEERLRALGYAGATNEAHSDAGVRTPNPGVPAPNQ